MLEKCFFSLAFLSALFAVFTGNIVNLSNAVIDGAAKAISLIIALGGTMCLWSGVMEVLKCSGAIGLLSRVLSPVLRHVFPRAWKTGVAKEEICAALSANILGIGNAATPLALSAMAKMQEANDDRERATPDMVTLAVLGASSLDLLPTTLIALRRAAGSSAPYIIILPVWICSFICSLLAVLFTRIGRRNA